jgi:SAM-dependent methyltransferase
VCNKSNPFPSAKYLVGDAETLDLQEKFDVVVCTEVLEHCPHPEMVALTIKRHIAKGGIGIVSVPNGFCFSEMVFSRLFQKIGIHSLFHKLPKNVYTSLTGSPTPYYSANVACHHVQFFTLGKILSLLNNSGFQILHIGNLDLGLFLDWTWLSLLKQIECNIADSVPHFLSGGWVFVIKPMDE